MGKQGLHLQRIVRCCMSKAWHTAHSASVQGKGTPESHRVFRSPVWIITQLAQVYAKQQRSVEWDAGLRGEARVGFQACQFRGGACGTCNWQCLLGD